MSHRNDGQNTPYLDSRGSFSSDEGILSSKQEALLRASIEPDFTSLEPGYFFPPNVTSHLAHDQTYSKDDEQQAHNQYEVPSWGNPSCYPPIIPQGNQQYEIHDAAAPYDIAGSETYSDDEDDEDEQKKQTRHHTTRLGGEVKHIGGYLYQREPGFKEFLPAVYHTDIRRQLIDEASGGGRYRYPHRRCRGTEKTNVTAYLRSNHDWTEDREHRPEVCFQFGLRTWPTPDYEPEIWMRDGLYVIDGHNRRMRLWRNLPLTISSEECGGFLEAWRREDSRIGLEDMMARMPKEFLKGTRRRKLYGISTINMRMNRFRVNACIKSWNERIGTQTIDSYLEFLLPPDCRAQNSTRGFRDLTKAEALIAWSLNKGTRQALSSEVTDKDRQRRKTSFENRIDRLIEQDHKKGIMTRWITREDLTAMHGELQIPPVTKGVWKGKRKAAQSDHSPEEASPPHYKWQKLTSSVHSTSAHYEQHDMAGQPYPQNLSPLEFPDIAYAPTIPLPSNPPPATPYNATDRDFANPTVPDFDDLDFDFHPLNNESLLNEGTKEWDAGEWSLSEYRYEGTRQSAPSPHSQNESLGHNPASSPQLIHPSSLSSQAQTALSPPSPLSDIPSEFDTTAPTNPEEIAQNQRAFEVSRNHARELLGSDAYVPPFNAAQPHAIQCLDLQSFFDEQWQIIHGTTTTAPKLEVVYPWTV